MLQTFIDIYTCPGKMFKSKTNWKTHPPSATPNSQLVVLTSRHILQLSGYWLQFFIWSIFIICIKRNNGCIYLYETKESICFLYSFRLFITIWCWKTKQYLVWRSLYILLILTCNYTVLWTTIQIYFIDLF